MIFEIDGNATMDKLLKDIDQNQKRINALRPLPQSLVAEIQAYYKVGLTSDPSLLAPQKWDRRSG